MPCSPDFLLPDVILSMIQQRAEQPNVASVSCATSLSIGTCESNIFRLPLWQKHLPPAAIPPPTNGEV